ncbi:hypothetical protein WA026_022875 [Henosepilachna vigintioctopunctata]|uniref:Reverse transcriptase n=1 Tax=Henosepilachna vigintioctopunctata TaxID=420089 RepID=A0AAW1U6J0_9CUCU
MEASKVAGSRALDWFTANHLRVNEEKTETVVFSLRRDDFLEGSFRFLGIFLDSRLRWAAHVEYISIKLSGNIYVLRQLSRSLSPTVLMIVYLALCESHMQYGVLAWAVRVLAGLGYRDCCRDAFQHLGILFFPALFLLECLIYAHENVVAANLRQDVHGHDTRGKNAIRLDYLRLSRSQTGSTFHCWKFFNSLPSSVQILPNNSFRRTAKKVLVANVLYDTNDFFNISFPV